MFWIIKLTLTQLFPNIIALIFLNLCQFCEQSAVEYLSDFALKHRVQMCQVCWLFHNNDTICILFVLVFAFLCQSVSIEKTLADSASS